MTTPTFMFPNQVASIDTPHREKAMALKASLTDKLAAIKASPDLTPEAKQRQIADATNTTRESLKQLQQDEGAAIAARRSDLENRLYGLKPNTADPSSTIVVRDALDRAAKIEDPADAITQLTRAARNGDPVLARAIAATARDRVIPGLPSAWNNVHDVFLQSYPELGQTATDLASVDNADSIAQKIGASMVFGI